MEIHLSHNNYNPYAPQNTPSASLSPLTALSHYPNSLSHKSNTSFIMSLENYYLTVLLPLSTIITLYTPLPPYLLPAALLALYTHAVFHSLTNYLNLMNSIHNNHSLILHKNVHFYTNISPHSFNTLLAVVDPSSYMLYTLPPLTLLLMDMSILLLLIFLETLAHSHARHVAHNYLYRNLFIFSILSLNTHTPYVMMKINVFNIVAVLTLLLTNTLDHNMVDLIMLVTLPLTLARLLMYLLHMHTNNMPDFNSMLSLVHNRSLTSYSLYIVIFTPLTLHVLITESFYFN